MLKRVQRQHFTHLACLFAYGPSSSRPILLAGHGGPPRYTKRAAELNHIEKRRLEGKGELQDMYKLRVESEGGGIEGEAQEETREMAAERALQSGKSKLK